MELTVSPQKFKTALEFVVSATDIGAMPNLLLETLDDSTLRISGANQIASAQRTCEVDVKTQGSICVPAKKLLGIIKNLEKETTIKTDKTNWVRILAGSYKGRLAATDVSQFPEFPTADTYPIIVTSEELSALIKSTAFSVTDEESRFSLHGVKLEIADGIAKIIATDGARVAYAETQLNGEMDEFLPKNSLVYLTKLPKGAVEIGENKNHLFFKIDDLILATRKTTGTFPDYAQVVNCKTDKELSVPLDEFTTTFKRVLETADDKVNAVKFEIKPNELTLSTATNEGESEETIDIDYEGKETTINLNAAFLKDFLNSAKGDRLHMLFTNSESPVKLNFGKDNYTYLVMPLRTT